MSDSNQNLAAALARPEQARADPRARPAGSDPDCERQRDPRAHPLNVPTYVPGRPASGDLFTLGADLSYEIDLWGVRNTVAGARYSEQATAGRYGGAGSVRARRTGHGLLTLRGLTSSTAVDQHGRRLMPALALTQNL